MVKIVKTFKDIKDIIKEVPDDILDKLYIGLGEGREEDIGIVSPEEDEGFPLIFDKIDGKYPDLNEVFKLIENIQKAQKFIDMDPGDDLFDIIWEGGLSSDTKFPQEGELEELIKEKLKKQWRKMKSGNRYNI